MMYLVKHSLMWRERVSLYVVIADGVGRKPGAFEICVKWIFSKVAEELWKTNITEVECGKRKVASLHAVKAY